MREQGIGKGIYELRKEAGYTQSQLAKGVCSVSELAKLESGEIMLNHLQIDRLFSRLGKAPAKLIYLLPKEIYQIYAIRYHIQRCIAIKELEQAETLLCKYERMKRSEEPLNRQFIEMQRAQVSWIQGRMYEEIASLIGQAIRRTILEENAMKMGDALSSEELNLLLFRWEVSKESDNPRPVGELKELLAYCERHCTDQEELTKVYPYVALLLAKYGECAVEESELRYILKKALELLREEGKVFFMPEVIEQYVRYAETTEKEEIQQLQSSRRALLEIGEMFHIDFVKLRLFEQVSREFELDYEVIRKSRAAKKLSQEQVCEGICTRETLSRIERGKTSPTHKNLKKVLEVLHRDGERVNTVLLTEDYNILEKKRELVKYVFQLEYDKAKEVVVELSRQLDQSIPKNRQYILGERLRVEFHEGKISYEEGVKELYEILKLTLDVEEEEISESFLSLYEVALLNKIAILHYGHAAIDKAIEIYEKILNNWENSILEEVFHMRSWELVVANLASSFEMTKKPDESLEVSKWRVKIALEIGRGIDMGRAFGTIACALEQKQDIVCKKYFDWALDILYLMKNYNRYQLIKEYMAKPNFLNWLES